MKIVEVIFDDEKDRKSTTKRMTKETDGEVVALRDGFYAVLSGKLYGPWKMREYALAGLEVERKRLKSKRINKS